MANIEQSIDVQVPVRTAYDQWTQFEEFPQFMEGVEEIRQLDDTHTHWRTKVAGKEKEFDAEITEQTPDQRIAWQSEDGPEHAGVVTFHRIDDGVTRVMLQMDYSRTASRRRRATRSASSSAASRATWSGSRSSSSHAAGVRRLARRGRAGRDALGEPGPHREHGGLDASFDPELAQDARDVVLHGARAEEEAFGDVGVVQALGDEPEDLDLAPGEVGGRSRDGLRRRLLLADALDERRGRGRGDDGLAVGRGS